MATTKYAAGVFATLFALTGCSTGALDVAHTPSVSPAFVERAAGDLTAGSSAASYSLADVDSTLRDAAAVPVNGIYGSGVAHGGDALTSEGRPSASFPGGRYDAANIAVTPPAATLRPANAMSLGAWFSAGDTNSGGYDTPLIAYGSADRAAYAFKLTATTNRLAFEVSTSSGFARIVTSDPMPLGATVYAVGTYDGSAVRLYVNGALQAAGAASGAVRYAGGPQGLSIGGRAGDPVPTFAGAVQDVSLYASALPATTVRQTYAALAKSGGSRAASGNVATYGGCPIFTANDYYNADITTKSLDPHSASYMASVTATDTAGFYASTGVEQLNVATSSTKTYRVHQDVPYHTFPVPYPWASGFYIEPAGDAHAMVLLKTPPACHLFESYSTGFSNNVLSAYSGANWDLSKPFVVLPNHSPSAMASGLSLFAGMVKYEEIAGGIHHALNFTLFAGTPCNCFTAPASDTDGLPYKGPPTSYALPYGAHLRLKASFDDSHFGPQSKAIAEALKHYGGYLADTSNGNNAIYTANPTSGGAWNSGDLNSLGSITPRDFDVLPIGKTNN